MVKTDNIVVPDTQPSGEDDVETKDIELLEEKRELMLKYTLKDKLKPTMVGICAGIFGIYIIRTIIMYITAAWTLNYELINMSFFSILTIPLSVVLFCWSTLYEWWNFFKQKKLLLLLATINYSLQVYRMFLVGILGLDIKFCMCIQLSEYVTKDMVIVLARFLVVAIGGYAYAFTLYFIIKYVFDIRMMAEIQDFRFNLAFDLRKDRKYRFDLHIIKYMKNGKKYVIRENDRMLHMCIDGTSGTGKTSSTMYVQICEDLDKNILREDRQKKLLLKAIKENKIYINKPFNDNDFNIANFSAAKGYEKLLQEIAINYGRCGITVIAPNSGLTDDVYDLAKRRNMKVNRVDPIPVAGTPNKKEGFIGFNPLYISDRIPEWDRNREISKKASLFSSVLESIKELKGKGDEYFTSLNRQITVVIVILLCKTYPRLNNGKQPNPTHVQKLINSFDEIPKYLDEFLKLPQEDLEQYDYVVQTINMNLLGPLRKEMEKQITGLKNILNDFLSNPLIRDILCCEESVDMDRMLEDGEITILNYALEVGTADAIGFGLFFILNFNDAVLRRPGSTKTRRMHFLDVDEFIIILHPELEKMFTLYRQYRVGAIVAIQSLEQMDKTDVTKYLKGVITGNCAHQIVFGRTSATEMKLYSELAGKKWTVQEQTSSTESSITTENPNITFARRTSEVLSNVTEGYEIRNRKFQEITCFGVTEANVNPPFHGKVSFLSHYKVHRSPKRFEVDWMKLYSEKKAQTLANLNIFMPGDGILSDKEHVTEKQPQLIMNGQMVTHEHTSHVDETSNISHTEKSSDVTSNAPNSTEQAKSEPEEINHKKDYRTAEELAEPEMNTNERNEDENDEYLDF